MKRLCKKKHPRQSVYFFFCVPIVKIWRRSSSFINCAPRRAWRIEEERVVIQKLFRVFEIGGDDGSITVDFLSIRVDVSLGGTVLIEYKFTGLEGG